MIFSNGSCSKATYWPAGGRKEETEDVRVVEASGFWSSYSTMITSGHLCTLPAAKPLSGISSSVPLHLPSSSAWFLALPTRGECTLPCSLPHSLLLCRARPSRRLLWVCHRLLGRRFSSWPVRLLATRLAQIGAHRILNERGGSNRACLCLSCRRHSFHFFIVFARFKMRAWEMPLKWRMVAR